MPYYDILALVDLFLKPVYVAYASGRGTPDLDHDSDAATAIPATPQ